MNATLRSLCACIVIVLFCSLAGAQSTNSTQSPIVPPLVKFSGVLTDVNSKPLTGPVGVTFSLYKESEGGTALWTETQNVAPDKTGHYTVMLGSTTSEGLPGNVFASGEARWLGVQAQEQAEQPRTLLMSVPYALKAADAQTLGGLPSSAFVLAAPPNSGSSSASPSNGGSNPNPPSGSVTGSGTADYVPLWTSGSNIGNSVLYQSGTGSKAKIGINTTKPSSTLDVKGGSTVRGLFSLPSTGTATAGAGFNSQPIDQAASVFNSSAQTAVPQTFQWQAEPVNNNTSNATGSLNLLFAQGSGKPAETGLNIASNGQINFASGQTFPGTGTITGVTAGSDLTGGGSSGNVTLNLDTTKVPLLAAANTFTANQAVNGTMTANAFSGNGSALTNVNAASLNGLSAISFSQLATSNLYQSSPLGTAIPQVLEPVNNATTSGGFSSNPIDLAASSYNSGASAAQKETFRWQAEAAGNNTGSPSGTLNLLFGANGAAPTETGLNIASNGQMTFANGQTFPGTGTITGITTASGGGLSGGGTSGNLSLSLVNNCATNQVLQWTGSAWACFSAGNGTITGVTAGTDLTGGGASGNVTLNLDTTQVPQLNAANTFTGVLTVNVPPQSGSPAITANDTSSTAAGGVFAKSTYGIAVDASSTNGNAVSAASTNGTGVIGTGITGVTGTGVVGVYGGGGNYGVQGVVTYGIGVYGAAGDSDSAIGVYGAGEYGVQGIGNSYGVYATGGVYGVLGESGSSSGSGGGFSNSTTGDALFTYNQSGGYAAFFDGNVDVDGKLSKAGGQFHIDHPLDPANRYLNHSFVESPDMKNIYDGNVTTDSSGLATIALPDWFDVLNRDFRYQLTVIGQFAQAIVAKKIENNQFQIRTSLPNVEVSWQVTGIRQDAWANANRIPVEEEKEAKLKGFYLHPELYGAPAEKGIAWARHPEMMKKLQQDQEQMKEKQAGLTESPTIARPRPIPPPILKKPATLILPAALPHRATK
jgi:hypothetical protein